MLAFRAALALIAAALVFHWLLPWCVAIPDGLRAPLPENVVVTDRNGVVLRSLLHNRTYRHERVALDAVPADLVACTLAAEDRRFWKHSGIDFLAAARTGWEIIRHGRVVSGASTITQQLVKISSPRSSRTVGTKLREMLVARRIEMTWSKRRILEEYLNRLDYGSMTRGCAAAAERYFQKPLSQLSTGECALLAALPQAPSRLNPLRHPERAIARQRVVLERAAKLDLLPPVTAAKAAETALAFHPLPRQNLAPHFVQMVLGKIDPGAGGRVQSTIDAALQREVESTLAGSLDALRDYNVANAAAVVIDNATGGILALAGSGDIHSARGGWINGATRRRSAGSTLKPFTYAHAFEHGWYPGGIVADVAARYPDSGGFFTPQNYDRQYHGPVSLRCALANSLNAAAVNLLASLGGPEPLHDDLARAGITRLESAAHYGLGLTIGNAAVSPLELTNAYAALARMGEWKPLRILENERATIPSRRVFSAESCFLVADVLSDNAARSLAFGAESPLRFPFRVASKTGTSSDFRDNWCVGFTPQFTVGVWMGNHDQTPMRGVSGVTGAATAFHRIMTVLHESAEPSWFEPPVGLVKGAIDTRTGHIAVLPVPAEWTRVEWFPSTQPPPVATGAEYDTRGNALLPDAVFAEWFGSEFNHQTGGFALESSVRARQVPPRFISPQPNATYVIDPELPGSGGKLPLACNLADAQWSSPTLPISAVGGSTFAALTPGRHRILVMDSRSGLHAEAWITVEQR